MRLTLEQYETLIIDYDKMLDRVSSTGGGIDGLARHLSERLGDWITFPVSIWMLDEPLAEIEVGQMCNLRFHSYQKDPATSAEYDFPDFIPVIPKRPPGSSGGEFPFVSLADVALHKQRPEINNRLQPYNQDAPLFYQRQFAIDNRIESVMIVPLIGKSEIIGTMSLYSSRPSFFTFQDSQLAHQLSRLAALFMQQEKSVIALKKLSEDTKKQIGRISKIRTFSASIKKEETLNAKFDRIACEATEMLDSSGGVLYLRVEGERRIKIESSCGVLSKVPLGTTLDFGVGMAGKLIAEEHEYLIENDFPNSEVLRIHRKALRVFEGKFEAVIEVPIIVAKEIIGVLAIVSSEEGRKYDLSDVNSLKLLSDLAANEIERAGHGTLSGSNSRLHLLGRDVEYDILEFFCKELKLIFSAEQVDIHMIRDDSITEMIQIPERKGYPGSRYSNRNEMSLVREVVENNQVIYIDDVASNEMVNRYLTSHYHYAIILGLPLVHEDHKIGAVFVNLKSDRTVSRHEIAMLDLLGQEVSAHIYQLRLMKQFEEQQRIAGIQRQEFLRNIAHNISKPVIPAIGLLELIQEYAAKGYHTSEGKIVHLLQQLHDQLHFMQYTFQNFTEEYKDGDITLEIEEVNIVDLVVKVISFLNPYTQKRRSIEIDFVNHGT